MSFTRNEDGHVAILFALMSVVMTGMTGMAVDYARALTARDHLQTAVDSAAMAGVTQGNATDEQRIQSATAVFNANLKGYNLAEMPSPLITYAAGTMTVKADASIPTAFTAMLGINSLSVSAQSTAMSVGKTLEVSLMLDISSSMSGTKVAEMREAAKDMLDIVLRPDLDTDGTPKTRAALVPFASKVNAGSYASAATGLPPTRTETTTTTTYSFTATGSDWLSRSDCAARVRQVHPSYSTSTSEDYCRSNFPNRRVDGVRQYDTPRVASSTSTSTVVKNLITCVTERTGAQRYTDAAPGTDAYVGSTSPSSGIAAQYSTSGACVISSQNQAEIRPLSADKDALKAHIDTMVITSGTAGHVGTAWSWYTISPSWNPVFPTASAAKPYGLGTNIKAAVLMTDGAYNSSLSSTSASDQARSLCTAMKAQGIVIYTIGFDMDSEPESSRQLLRDCATSSAHYFFPYDGTELRNAFRSIGQALSAAQGSARLVQ
jgi:Flp pilus assembly protein TadG